MIKSDTPATPELGRNHGLNVAIGSGSTSMMNIIRRGVAFGNFLLGCAYAILLSECVGGGCHAEISPLATLVYYCWITSAVILMILACLIAIFKPPSRIAWCGIVLGVLVMTAETVKTYYNYEISYEAADVPNDPKGLILLLIWALVTLLQTSGLNKRPAQEAANPTPGAFEQPA